MVWIINSSYTVSQFRTLQIRVCRSQLADATMSLPLAAPTLTATDNCGTAAVTYAEVRTEWNLCQIIVYLKPGRLMSVD
jgi:hypothetical protein